MRRHHDAVRVLQHTAPATGVSFSPLNNVLLASVSLDSNIVFYDLNTRSIVPALLAQPAGAGRRGAGRGGAARGQFCVFYI